VREQQDLLPALKTSAHLTRSIHCLVGLAVAGWRLDEHKRGGPGYLGANVLN
jgi:hypothetical protein